MKGKKFDNGKLQWHLLPIRPLKQIVRVMQFGADKYGPFDWQRLKDPEERYYNALLRHIFAWREGEKLDPETGIHHLAHAGANIIFLLWFDNEKLS